MMARLTRLLGREPRGLEALARSRADGAPVVIRVASLVDDRPFPTLFWLVDPDLCYALDRLEADGLIGELQATVDGDQALRRAMIADHRAHIRLRDSYLAPYRWRVEALGYAGVLSARGIGGIADFSRIRCLHTWYAAHLVIPNTLGQLIERRLGGYLPSWPALAPPVL